MYQYIQLSFLIHCKWKAYKPKNIPCYMQEFPAEWASLAFIYTWWILIKGRNSIFCYNNFRSEYQSVFFFLISYKFPIWISKLDLCKFMYVLIQKRSRKNSKQLIISSLFVVFEIIANKNKSSFCFMYLTDQKIIIASKIFVPRIGRNPTWLNLVKFAQNWGSCDGSFSSWKIQHDPSIFFEHF